MPMANSQLINCQKPEIGGSDVIMKFNTHECDPCGILAIYYLSLRIPINNSGE